ncbi:MAG TPA: adenosylhomocysteinase [Bryobacteraceae bacterium]|nr:adenosylhomocysteinase [Bryobacteraceae bacterium]
MPSVSTAPFACDIRDIALADAGKRRIDWAFQSMPVLRNIRKQFIKTQPLQDVRVAACLRVTPQTANLAVILRDGGAHVLVCGANPALIEDDVAASLVRDYGIPVFAVQGAGATVHEAHVQATVDHRPNLVMDEGGELHSVRTDLLNGAIGGTESTMNGAARIRLLAKDGELRYPIVALSEANTRRLVELRCGGAQSSIETILRATNVLLAGLTIVVAGYGWRGRGFAARTRGMGANVVVTEVDPMRALEAILDGYRVKPLADAAAIADLIVTLTGTRNVLSRDHFERLKDGAYLCNAGYSNAEIDVDTLAKMSSTRRPAGDLLEEFVMRDGRKRYVLADGHPIHEIASTEIPAAVADLDLAAQALAAEFVVRNHAKLDKRLYAFPDELDRQVARMKLESMSVTIDRLSQEQEGA